MKQFSFFALFCIIVVSPNLLIAETSDVTLKTDHPDYPGEGAFQTIEDCVAFAIRSANTPQDRAIALYHWLLTHQFHLHSPQEWNVPGETPGQRTDDYEMVVYDANRSRFSYGYGLCGTVHAWNEPYWKALGMLSRRRAFPGHVNSEVHYDGGWHAFDTDMAGLIFRRDGIVAGYHDIAKDLSLVRPNENGIVCYPFAWPGDFETMKKGWEQIASGGDWYSMYNGGYAAMPGIVSLRRGESFVRYFDRDAFGGPSKRRFWHVQKDGPFRNWTFVNMGLPQHSLEKSNSRGNASYANAVFRYTPNLANGDWLEGTLEKKHPEGIVASSRGLFNSTTRNVSVTFEHFSPYVICGDPLDDTNPMSGKASDGMVLAGNCDGDVSLEVSVDQGQTWTRHGEIKSDFRVDFTEYVKGRYGWWIRFDLAPQASITSVRFDTTCQVNQAIYPRLKPGGSKVTYRTGQVGVVAVKPNFGLPEQAATRDEVLKLRSPNIRYTPRSRKQVIAYSTSPHSPAEVAFRITSPGPLVEVIAAARYAVRSPQPADSAFRLEYSVDGTTWRELATSPKAADNEYSSGWVFGRVPVTDANAQEAIVKVHLNGGGSPTGLIDFEAYGVYRKPEPPQSLEITWAWKTPDSQQAQIQREVIPAGQIEHTWTIDTPATLSDAWVEIANRPTGAR